MKVHIQPRFRGVDSGDGGIRRIVEAQQEWLPRLGIEVVDDLNQADFVVTHAGLTVPAPNHMPWIVHTHGLYWQEYNWPVWAHDLNYKVIAAMRQADHVTAPSEWVAQVLRRAMWLDPTVLHHGIDLEAWEPSPSPQDYILWNKNRPDPVCDPGPMLEVAAAAPDLQFKTTFGEGGDNVQTVGRIGYREMWDLVRNAGVYLCTVRETFGIGTLEAMAAGVPVVGWAWGGQREIIKHGETGWLCQPGDIAGLEEGIRWSLKHRAQIGANARQAVAERWTWDRIMPQYAELYESVYKDKRARVSAPRVSVVVPCYNLGRYLPDTLQSLQAQTMEDWECIVVNDASPDDTAEVAAAWAARDPRIKVITNASNLYVAGALNAGIAASTGQYVCALDADNMIAPGTLAILADALTDDRTIDITYGACRFVLEDGKTPDKSVSANGISSWPTEFDFKSQQLHRNQIPSTCMFRREMWERTGGYRRRCRTGEDPELWMRATALGFVPKKVTNQVTLIYRQRPDSMSSVEPDWDYTAWYPGSRQMNLVPFGVAEKPPKWLNKGIAWNVPAYEPPKVAVVIPVGPGHEGLLIDALDSVDAQTYQRWECIVANDTGHPLDIPHTWAKVIDLGPARRGPAAARNAAIAVSTAPLFVALDADDYLQADALEEWVGVSDAVGGVVYSQWYDDHGPDGTEVYDPPDYDPRLLVSKGAIHAVTALYPKSAWRKVGGFDEDLSHWEDWDFQILLADIGVCGTKVPRPLWTYRKRTGWRREENRAAWNEGRDAILAKWSRLWDGGEELMACTGCGGGGGQRYAAPPPTQLNGGARPSRLQPREGYAALEYQGVSTGTRTYKGTSTNTQYRFGNSPTQRIKYVYEADLPALMALSDGGRPLFLLQSTAELAEEHDHSPAMEATGPPDRTGAPAPLDGPPVATAPPPENGGPPAEPDPSGQPPPPVFGPDATVREPDTSAPAPEVQIYSTRELRSLVGNWSEEQIRQHLALEMAQPTPRATAIAHLKGRLPPEDQPG